MIIDTENKTAPAIVRELVPIALYIPITKRIKQNSHQTPHGLSDMRNTSTQDFQRFCLTCPHNSKGWIDVNAWRHRAPKVGSGIINPHPEENKNRWRAYNAHATGNFPRLCSDNGKYT
jgi:hypothetical protein